MAKFIISGVGSEVSDDLTEQLDTFETAGIRYIETRVVNGRNVSEITLEQAKEAKAEMDKRGFGVSAVSSPIGKSAITEPFGGKLPLFRHVVEIAGIFKTKYIRIFSFYIPQNEKAENYRSEVIDRLKTMLEIAGENDVTLLVENEAGIYGDSPERLLDIFTALNSPNLKLMLDAPNFIKAGYEAYPKAFDMLYDHIGCVHAKDSLNDRTIVPFGEGDTHALEYLKRLDKKDFTCFLTLEPHVHEINGLEGEYARYGLEKNRSSAFRLACVSFKKTLTAVTAILD